MPPHEPISLEMLLWAYAHGIFPMADDPDEPAQWFSANPRAVLPLDQFKVSHSLRQRLRRGDYEIRFNTAFETVIRSCGQPRKGKGATWINEQIIDAFKLAHEHGFTHSIEAWGTPREEDAVAKQQREASGDGRVLVGGLYGLSLGGAFFGESMFSRATDASKVCLVHLVERMKERGMVLLDVQMNSGHMAQFGTIDIPKEEYERQLAIAVKMKVSW